MGNATLATIGIKSRESWIEVRNEWDELVASRPMQSMTWMLEWWDQFQSPNKSLHILLFRDGNKLVGIAPLYAVQVGSRSILRLLGDTGDICTDHTTWFARAGYEQAVGHAVAEQLLELSDWTRLHLESVDDADKAMSASLRKLESNGCLMHTTKQESCWSVELPETWEEYLSMLSKNHRKRCRRWVKNFFDNGRIQIHSATLAHGSESPSDDWETSWHVFLDLHRQRWGNAKRPDGCFSNHRFAEFHKNVSHQLAEAQQLRLCYLTLDGEPIASEYQMFDHDTLYSYQSGMSAEHRDIGPGNLSLVATVRYCIDNGLRRLDLLRGDEEYKAHWHASPSQRADVRIWQPGLHGKVEYNLQKARRLAADWLRR